MKLPNRRGSEAAATAPKPENVACGKPTMLLNLKSGVGASLFALVGGGR